MADLLEISGLNYLYHFYKNLILITILFLIGIILFDISNINLFTSNSKLHLFTRILVNALEGNLYIKNSNSFELINYLFCYLLITPFNFFRVFYYNIILTILKIIKANK